MNWLGYQVCGFLSKEDTVLDLGCGTLFPFGHEPIPNIKDYCGVDVWETYTNAIDVKTVVHDLRITPFPFADDSFDTVLCLDVIEHLPFDDGLALMHEMIRIARRQCVIFTPDGFMESHSHNSWGLGDNPHQKHVSGWKMSDFLPHGFKREVSIEGILCRKVW